MNYGPNGFTNDGLQKKCVFQVDKNLDIQDYKLLMLYGQLEE